MATRSVPVRSPPARRLRRAGALAVLLAVLTEGVLSGNRPAAAGGPPAAQVLSVVVTAYGQVGTVAVALTVQQTPVEGPLVRSGARVPADRLARHTADNGAAASRPFPAASMVKLFVAEDLLHRARSGAITLTRRDFAVLQEMIRRSDDPAASELWVRFDGDRMVRDVAARYGLTDTAPPAVPGRWGEATTTALDLARFLSLLPVVAHPYDAAALLVWMRTATPVAADGFDQRFGLFGAVPGRTAVKQGWMCCVGGFRHMHSVGVVGSRVVVLLSEVPRTVGYAAAGAALTAAAAAVPAPRHP